MTAIVTAQTRSKFYDFNEQLIDGEIKKPTTCIIGGSKISTKIGILLDCEIFKIIKASLFVRLFCFKIFFIASN